MGSEMCIRDRGRPTSVISLKCLRHLSGAPPAGAACVPAIARAERIRAEAIFIVCVIDGATVCAFKPFCVVATPAQRRQKLAAETVPRGYIAGVPSVPSVARPLRLGVPLAIQALWQVALPWMCRK